MTLMKSRCGIASPKAWDYADPAFGTAITAGIGERQNGFGGAACAAAMAQELPLRLQEK